MATEFKEGLFDGLAAGRSPAALGHRAVHVIDDDEAVLRGIAMLLKSVRIPVVTYKSGISFLDALDGLDSQSIGCVLTDLRMPGLDGIALLRRLRARSFCRPIVVMTAHGDISTAVRSMKEGAADFVEKPFEDEEFLATIEVSLKRPDTAAAGDPSPAMPNAELRPGAAEAAARLSKLSEREHEVLRLLVAGKPNKAIARELGLSPRTIEVHRARLMARLGVTSLAEVVRLALHANLLSC